MPRPNVTGSIWSPKDSNGAPRRWPSGAVRYRGKVTWPDGKRQDVAVLEAHCTDEDTARAYVKQVQKELDATGTGLLASAKGAPVETCNAWYERFKVYRRKEVGSVDDDAWRWAKWIAPSIGTKPIVSVTPDHIEDIRDALTAAVLAYEAAGSVQGDGRLAPKTAQNVWAALTTPFKYASTRKGPRDLRVREAQGNPCLGTAPPRDGASKHRHWLRPDQFVKLIARKDVPRAWRDAYAVGLYLHLRPGELHELRVKDLDLAHGEVRISRAFDERTKTVTTPKTEEGIRTVTAPATLLPLLKRIAEGRDGEERVCPIVAATPEKSRAGIFREHLGVAKVEAPAFFVETATHLMIDFRSLRDSGITWRFLAEHRAEVVQREAGHEHIATTLGYAKEVQDKRGRYGEPFPELLDDLVGGGPPPGPLSTPTVYKSKNVGKNGSGRRDLNPRRRAPKARALPDCATPRRSPRSSTPRGERLPRAAHRRRGPRVSRPARATACREAPRTPAATRWGLP
jgi:integrase